MVPSPNPRGQHFNNLTSVSAISANNIWAVGASLNGGPNVAIIEHWNGSQWATASSPSPSGYSYLNGVAAVSGKHIWTVGIASDGNGHGNTLIETRC